MKRPLYLLPILLSLLTFSACSGLDAGPADPETASIDIVIAPYFSYSPLFVGIHDGVFAEAGIDLQVADVQRSSEALVALAEGRIDVVPGTLFPGHFNAMSRGADIRAVAGTNYMNPASCVERAIVVRSGFLPASGELTPEHLAQAKVSANPASFSGYTIDRALQQYGSSLDEVEIVDIPSSAEIDAFSQGSLDVSLVAEPWLSRMVDGGAVELWLPINDLLPDAQVGLLFYGSSLLGEDPELGTRFLRAYLHAVDRFERGATSSNLKALSAAFEVEPELIDAMCWPSFRADGRPNLETIQAFQEWAYQRGYLDEILPPEAYWQPSVIDSMRDG